MDASKIKMIRIDDRLIHGQVMTAWLHYARVNDILIIDNHTASDSFIKDIIEIVVPQTVNVHVLSIIEGIEFLKQYDGAPLLVLVKTPFVLQVLVDEGITFNRIVVGGMASGQGRRKLYKAVSASIDEIDSFKHLLDLGIEIVVQIVPDEKPINISELL